jgi:UDP-N-acetylmuramate dehydrogenase
MNIDRIFEDIQQLVTAGTVKRHESLKPLVYTRIGGEADIWVAPGTYDEIRLIVAYAREQHIPLTILGNGSNVIIRDGGIRGIVLQTSTLTEIGSRDGGRIYAQCGAKIIDASRYALQQKLSGLEFACGIPGTVGGALYMNAGAYGGEVKDVLESALVLTRDGEIVTLSGDQFHWGYRSSIFASDAFVVLEAQFALQPGEPATIQSLMEELTYLRESKQPLEYPSCGSVFKRPPGRYAGQLIQESGLQGIRIGGAEVSRKHAGFIVNTDEATASDYIGLIEHVRSTVKAKFDVELETEVEIIGEEA